MSKPVAVARSSIWARYGWLIAGGLLLLAVAALLALPGPPRRQQDDPDRALLERYVEALHSGADVAPFLGPKAVFDDEPVSEEEAEARYADYYLRMKGLLVRGVLDGEPGPDGKQRPVPHRFTLVTRAQGSTPPLNVRNRAGEVERGSRLFIMNPTLVVEVRDGKIHGLRTELHRD